MRGFLRRKLFFERHWFRALVAKQCYVLTHEYVTNTMYSNSNDGRFTGHTDAALLELDRQMLVFTNSVIARETR
jgi:hypothetical protein